MLSPGSHLHMNKPLKMTDGPVQTDGGISTEEKGAWPDGCAPGSQTKDKGKSSNYLCNALSPKSDPDPCLLSPGECVMCVYLVVKIFLLVEK